MSKLEQAARHYVAVRDKGMGASAIEEQNDAWRALVQAANTVAVPELQALRERAEAAEADAAAVRELMNVYNLGGWTDTVAPMKRALKAEQDAAEWKEAFHRATGTMSAGDALALELKGELNAPLTTASASGARSLEEACGNCIDVAGCLSNRWCDIEGHVVSASGRSE